MLVAGVKTREKRPAGKNCGRNARRHFQTTASRKMNAVKSKNKNQPAIRIEKVKKYILLKPLPSLCFMQQ